MAASASANSDMELNISLEELNKQQNGYLSSLLSTDDLRNIFRSSVYEEYTNRLYQQINKTKNDNIINYYKNVVQPSFYLWHTFFINLLNYIRNNDIQKKDNFQYLLYLYECLTPDFGSKDNTRNDRSDLIMAPLYNDIILPSITKNDVKEFIRCGYEEAKLEDKSEHKSKHEPAFEDVLIPKPKNKPLIKLYNIDVVCLTELIDAYHTKNKTEYYKPNCICVLNLANAFKAGGGVLNGAFAQEEELFRRTNLNLSLGIGKYDVPMDFSEGEVFHSNNITVITTQLYDTYKSDIRFGVISAAALSYEGTLSEKWDKRMKMAKEVEEKGEMYMLRKTIENIFITAYTKEHKILVLGSIGCGAFNNDAMVVARMFKDAIDKYGHLFNEIYFSIMKFNNVIPSGSWINEKLNPNGHNEGIDTYNYNSFKRVLFESQSSSQLNEEAKEETNEDKANIPLIDVNANKPSNNTNENININSQTEPSYINKWIVGGTIIGLCIIGLSIYGINRKKKHKRDN
jgi:uncharacterized protein (TIGR02452 family)